MKCYICGLTGLQETKWSKKTTLVKCRHCGHVRQAEPDLKAIAQAYQDEYPDHHAQSWWWTAGLQLLTRRRVSSIAKLMPAPNTKIIEIGCGEGDLLEGLSHLGYSQVEGLDYSLPAVTICQEKGLHVMQADIQTVRLKKKTYDLVLMQQVIEHLSDPASVLVKLFDTLKSGSQLVLSTPNADSWQIRFFGHYWHSWHQPYHLHIFTPESLKLMCQKAGFTTVQIKYSLVPNDFYGSLVKALQSKFPKDIINHGFTRGLLFGLSLPIAVLEMLLGASSRFEVIAHKRDRL